MEELNDTRAGGSKQVTSLLEDARLRLVETGTRNRLIHVNRENRRANTLNIINERADDIFSILKANGRRMKFFATGKDRRRGDPVETGDDSSDAEDEIVLALPNDPDFDNARYTDNFLETPLGPDAQQKRLLQLSRDARTAEEEQGINILYLAIGFLTWFEAKSSRVKREAPIILLPVELIRNERTSTYDICCRDDDIVSNLPLQERLRQDFGIILPDIEELSAGEDDIWSPSAYFDKIDDIIASREGWHVDRDGMQLGFFSFAKLLMLRDLDPENWPGETLVENELVQRLLIDGFAAESPLFGPDDRLDQHLTPSDIIQVVDADASQTKVVEEVRAGRNLVVQGPPGTGKSQTITNIIAAAVHDGKTVLFMAEKMAALSVVHRRLVNAGLRDLCLELHSRSANKKAVLHELGQTIVAGASVPTLPGPPDKLHAIRDQLNDIADALHTPLNNCDYSPFNVMAEISSMLGREVPPPTLAAKDLDILSRDQRKTVVGYIRDYCATLAITGPSKTHPFAGTQNLDLQPPDLQRLAAELDSVVTAGRDLQDQLESLSASLNVATPDNLQEAEAFAALRGFLAAVPENAISATPTLFDSCSDKRLKEGLAAGVDWRASQESVAELFADAAWDANITHLREPLTRGVSSFLNRIFGAYRGASRELASLLAAPLPTAPKERLALLDQLSVVQRKRKLLAEDEPWLKASLHETWRGERTIFAELETTRAWLEKIKMSGLVRDATHLTDILTACTQSLKDNENLASAIRAFRDAASKTIDRLSLSSADPGDLETRSLTEQWARYSNMRENIERYEEWGQLCHGAKTLGDVGLDALVGNIDSHQLPPERAVDEFLYASAEARWKRALAACPSLNGLRNINRHDLVTAFRTLERERLSDNKILILAKHLEQVPKGASGEMGFIRGEIARKRGHKPIRRLMQAAGHMIQRIKPVFLMSPISIAQFLPPGSVKFDILVIDEASQVRPEDSLGAVSRAKQIIVVGDQKQLPPTSFFDRLTGNDQDLSDEDEGQPQAAKATELESILSLCEARGMRPAMLEWHYRSKDPSLIRVSNLEFYDDRLILPPSPLQHDDNYGLALTRVAGVYSSASKGGGRAGTNQIEARAVVDAMAEQARDWPGLSLGVVTFSKAQADMVTEVMELKRREDPVLDHFLKDEGWTEPVFVKNIENVQGDERDVVLISVGYGPHEPRGRLMHMTFGPINSDGGERRLNVLFSRARARCRVFTSFSPGDIDLSRTTKEGPRVLKRFLQFAESGTLDQQIVTGEDTDSPFEDDVIHEIRKLGYIADPQVGSAGFRIDVGVRHPDRPGQYVLAVECDGATYHSALWARERDRLRQDILESLGWHFHRIWSTDWFYNRRSEIQRLHEALNAAAEAVKDGISVEGANTGNPTTNDGDIDVLLDNGNLALERSTQPNDLAMPEISVPRYRRAQLTVRNNIEPHEVPINQLKDLVVQIVQSEGPIHTEEVARRLSSAFGKTRTGNRIMQATERALKQARRSEEIQSEGLFWFTPAQAVDIPVRDRSDETGTTVKATFLPPMEIRATAVLIKRENGQMTQEEMVRAIAHLLGFKRVGPDLQTAIVNAAWN